MLFLFLLLLLLLGAVLCIFGSKHNREKLTKAKIDETRSREQFHITMTNNLAKKSKNDLTILIFCHFDLENDFKIQI